MKTYPPLASNTGAVPEGAVPGAVCAKSGALHNTMNKEIVCFQLIPIALYFRRQLLRTNHS